MENKKKPNRAGKGRKTTRIRKANVDIGSMVKAKLRERRMTVVSFATLLGCSRTNIYKIFGKHTIDTDELFKISEILDFDFFKCYSDRFRNKPKKDS